jgi:hypothetical protein
VERAPRRRPGHAVVTDYSSGTACGHALARRLLPLDLRTLDRHPLASVGTLVLGLRCSWCPGSASMPKLLGLCALPPAAGSALGSYQP